MSRGLNTLDIPKVWLYHEGEWSVMADPLMAEHGTPEDGETWDQWLYHAGFIPADHWCGKQHIITIYEHDDSGPYSWRVTFGMTAHRDHVIMVKRLPDLIDLLAKLAPIALASEHGQQAPPVVPKPGKL